LSAPKPATKIKHKQGKTEVTLISNVDRVNYTIEELTKAALRDVGKVLKVYIKERTPVKTGLLQKSWQHWVKKERTTGEIKLQLGVYSAKQAKKKNQGYAHHAHLVLLGHATVNGGFVPGNNFFYDVVKENLGLVRDIEGQYLSAIEDEQTAIRLAEEEESKAEDD